MTVADTILAQIRAMDHWALDAWGDLRFQQIPRRSLHACEGTKVRREGGRPLSLRSGTYIVRAYKRNDHTGEAEVAEEWEEVFAEDLVPALDSVIG